MASPRSQRKSYRITWRSLRRGLLFMLPCSATLGIGQGILEGVLDRSPRQPQYLLILGPAIIVPLGLRLIWVPAEKPAQKATEDLLA